MTVFQTMLDALNAPGVDKDGLLAVSLIPRRFDWENNYLAQTENLTKFGWFQLDFLFYSF